MSVPFCTCSITTACAEQDENCPIHGRWLPDDEPANVAPAIERNANRAKAHTIATEAIRVALLRTGRIQLWPNPTGFDEIVKRPYGIGKGGADQVGLLKGLGRFVGFETKTGRGRLNKNQRAWHASVKKSGGFACVVHDVDEALAALDRAFIGSATADNRGILWRFFE